MFRLGSPGPYRNAAVHLAGWEIARVRPPAARRDFSAATPLGFSTPSSRIPQQAFQVTRLPAYEAWMTGAFVYCEAFWAHDAVGLRDPLLAQVEAYVG